MKPVTASILPVLVAVAVGSCPAVSQETAVYVDQQFGFRVEYPREWRKRDTSGTNMRLFVESNNADDACFFDVAPVPKSRDVPLSNVVAVAMEPGAFERILQRQMPNAKVLDIQRSRFGGQESIVAIYTNRHEAVGLIQEQQAIGTITWRGGFSFGGTCVTTALRFPAREKLYRIILGAFLFTPSPVR